MHKLCMIWIKNTNYLIWINWKGSNDLKKENKDLKKVYWEKKSCFCSLWIFEGNISNLRPFIRTVENWWWAKIVQVPKSHHKRNMIIINMNLCISTYSMSPEKEKNSLISCNDALRETLLTFTVLTCNAYTNWYQKIFIK